MSEEKDKKITCYSCGGHEFEYLNLAMCEWGLQNLCGSDGYIYQCKKCKVCVSGKTLEEAKERFTIWNNENLKEDAEKKGDMIKSIDLIFHNIRPLSKQNSRDRKTGGRTLKASYKRTKEVIQWEAKRQLMKAGWSMVTKESITIEYWIVWPFPPADFDNMTTWFTDALNGIAYIDDALIDDCAGIHPSIGPEKEVRIRLTRRPKTEFSRMNLSRRGM